MGVLPSPSRFMNVNPVRPSTQGKLRVPIAIFPVRQANDLT